METRPILPDAKPVKVLDKDLVCMFCKGTLFSEKTVKLNSRALVFMDMEMFSQAGKAYICANCGYKHEFFA